MCRSATEYEKILKVNVVGPYLTTINFLPLLRKKKSRVVVNMSSGLGSITRNRQGGPVANKWVAYNASSEHLALPCPAMPSLLSSLACLGFATMCTLKITISLCLSLCRHNSPLHKLWLMPFCVVQRRRSTCVSGQPYLFQ